jgi:hypothetical protein
VLDEYRKRVEDLRALRSLVEDQPQTEQTGHDLAAIRRTLELAEADLRAEMRKAGTRGAKAGRTGPAREEARLRRAPRPARP